MGGSRLRTGQLLNLSALSADAGIAVNTAKEWLSLLETSWLVMRLQPWHENLIVAERYKAASHRGIVPKLHFWRDSIGKGIKTLRGLLENLADAERHRRHPSR